MTTITIYDPTGEAVHEAPITKDARVFRQLGGDYYVELTLSVDKTLALPKGSYIRVSDPTTSGEEKYALRSDAAPEPISGVNGYKYVLKFYSRQHDMEACQIKWLAGGSQELSFRVTTSLRGFAKLIADNMNKYLGTTDWSFDGELDDTDMREQSFEGVSCWDAINNIANLFGVEWWVDHDKQLTIHFGKCENDGDATDIREGEIVNRFPAPKRGDDSNYGTRFYIFGGTQNVPENYREESAGSTNNTTFHIAEKRICLREFAENGLGPAGGYIPYFDAIKVPQAEIVEKTIILNDIFPKNETTIGTEDVTSVNENIIEGQDPQPVYYIKVEKKLTVLSTLGITFTSGALSGRSFGAAYTTQQGAIYVKVLHTTENSGGASLIAVPNANLAPKAGDKYILTGVDLDEDRITAAEREVWNKGTALALQYANDTNVYDCPVNPVYCSENYVNLALGAKVILKGAHFGEEGRKSRIQGYEKKLYNPYIATYNIGDNSVYSRTAKVVKDIQLPVAEAVASTERKNDSLSAQISSMQSNLQLTSIIQRLNDIEGYDTDTAESISIPGAKKYADKTVNGLRNYIDKIFSPIIGANTSLIGLLFFGGRNVSTDIYLPKPLALFSPSPDFLTRYDVREEDKELNPERAYYVKITTSNYTNYIGAVIAIEVDVTSDEFTDAFGYALHAGDWLVASPYGWKKISGSDVGGRNGVDFEEVKNWVETKLESYAKMPTEHPVQDSILIYDSNNQTFKGSDVQISTTVQDIENGEDSTIPTCGQVLEYVDDALSYKADKNGRYLNLAAGYYVENVELQGEMKSGNLNAGGGITNSSSTHLLIDISNVPNDSTIRVSTTSNSEYTTLWALWEVAYDPATVNWKYLLDKGPLCSVAQSADIDLSRYEGRAPRYLYVAVGAEGNSASATVILQTKNIAEKFDEIEEAISNVGENIEIKGTYPDVSVGGYLYTPDIYTEIRDGSLNDIGGISTPSAPRSYLFVDISHLAGIGKIAVKTTNNNAYSRLWALWKTPTAENGSNKVAIGPMSSESQEDVIDLSQYPDAKYLYVTIGAAGNSASATVQPQAKNIAEKFDEVEEALLYIPNIVLPTEIEVAVGDTLNLYYKSMIEANDIGNHQVEVLCDVGQSFPRYYTFQPLTSQAGKSYTLSVSLKNDRGEQLANANTNIIVKAIPTTTTAKNILTLGASMVANGNIAYELKRRLTTTSGDDTPANPTGIGLSNISFVGRQKAAYADVQQEATGGWAWRDYVSQGRQAYRFQVSGVKSINMSDVYVGGGLTFTITEINVTDGVGNIRCTYTGSGSIPTSGNLTRNTGNGDATIAYSSYASESYNPFYNDGALDIQHYADLYCNGAIDILIAVCGTNDLFTTRPIAEIMDDVKTFARAYHTAFPNGKFILSTLPLPSPIGGMGANYNATKDNYYNIALRMFGFAKGIYDMCKDGEFTSYVVDCSTLQTFDIDNLYPYTEKPVNNRMPNVKEKIGTNGVHPTIEGYKTIADALYSTVVGLL